MKEVEIEIRPNSISIGGAGVGDDPETAREILQSALDALDSDREKETFTNEIVVKNEIKK